MNKQSVGVMLLGLIVLMGGHAPAGQFFANADYEYLSIKIAGETYTPAMLLFSAGVKLTDRVALEGTVGTSAGDDKNHGITLKTNDLRALNLRFQTVEHNLLSLYALAGMAELAVEGKTVTDNRPGEDVFSGLQLSLGVNQRLETVPEMQWDLAVSRYDVDKAFDIYAVRAGLRYDF